VLIGEYSESPALKVKAIPYIDEGHPVPTGGARPLTGRENANEARASSSRAATNETSNNKETFHRKLLKICKLFFTFNFLYHSCNEFAVAGVLIPRTLRLLNIASISLIGSLAVQDPM